MPPRALLLVLLAFLALGAPAHAQSGGFAEIAQQLASDPVYVDPDAEEAISDREADQLREDIARKRAGPMYVAIVPGSLRDRAGGDTTEVARQIATNLRRNGTYAIIAGGQFRAGHIGPGLDRGIAPRIATDAVELRGDEGAFPILREFVDQIGAAKRNGGEPTSGGSDIGGGGFGGLGFLALLGGGLALFSFSRSRRRKREEQAQVAELRETAQEDLVALGEDVRALDLDVEMPNADPQGKEDYATALGHYEEAEKALDRARHPEDFGPIGQQLEEGRFAMAAAKARLNGRQPPERRPPCFFDPRHGPSTRDVNWSPDGYQDRPVPVCEADAVRLESGEAPMTREIVSGGRRMPLYDAPGYYAPYAGGFFGGFTGFLPGLLMGSMLGGGFGGLGMGMGGLGYGDAYGSAGGGGDFGGGGLGDFGGGDFGGGDFGGGGDF